MMAHIKVDKPICPEIPDRLTFARDDEFNHAVRRRVDQYFASVRRKPRDCPRMYLKTAVVLGWLAASYTLLVFFVDPAHGYSIPFACRVPAWWLALPLVVSLGMAMAAVGFNIQHDGGHHAYSDRPWINRLMARSLDLLGGSSYFWAQEAQRAASQLREHHGPRRRHRSRHPRPALATSAAAAVSQVSAVITCGRCTAFCP